MADAAGTISEQQALAGLSRARVSMVMTDTRQDDNPIVYVNDAFTELTGYARQTSIGRNCRFLQGPETDQAAVTRIRRSVEACEEISVELLNYRADGSTFRNRVIISPVVDETAGCIFFVGLQLEVKGDVDTSEMDTQLREVQHRVKNHLTMIIAMIRMQARSSSEPEELGALAHRIESLQLLYEEMSRADRARDDDRVSLGSYLSRIANAVAHLDGRPGVRVNVKVDEVSAPIGNATQLGLFLSEVLTNAFKHAFEGRDTGLVEVEVTRLSRGGLRLRVSDDGVGIPADVVWPKASSIGGRIMTGIVNGLNGSLDISRTGTGTTVTVDVPEPTTEDET